ncbi:hypothetical protein JDFR1000234_77 [uncultured archaeal virus]|uniref:Uncharacterized protein n=1 Tax=uncultured archaeal virus TaxID=1960247 RepID=A0A1S5Y383_9VIRU|nr:hypothetical protein JDFR1000234_77 [uncultured archaeal virus]
MTYIYPLRIKKITGSATVSAVPANSYKKATITLSEPYLVISAKVSTSTSNAEVDVVNFGEGQIEVRAYDSSGVQQDVAVSYTAWVLMGI